jgi:hypothetical protein
LAGLFFDFPRRFGQSPPFGGFVMFPSDRPADTTENTASRAGQSVRVVFKISEGSIPPQKLHQPTLFWSCGVLGKMLQANSLDWFRILNAAQLDSVSNEKRQIVGLAFFQVVKF